MIYQPPQGQPPPRNPKAPPPRRRGPRPAPSYLSAPLSPNYEGLATQFRAMRTLAATFEAQLGAYQDDARAEFHARAQLEGERAANAALTDEVERLTNEVERLTTELGRLTA